MDLEALISTYPSGNISTEYNESAEYVVNIIIDITSCVTLLTSLWIIYLIFYKFPSMMSTYRKYLLFNVCFEMLNVIIGSLGKPRILYEYFILFASGLLPCQNGVVTILCYVFWSNCLIWSSTCLVLIHIERYYAIHEDLSRNSYFLKPKFFVYFYLVVNVLSTSAIAISGLFGDVFIQGPAVAAYLEKLGGGKNLLAKYPGVVLLNNKYTIWSLVCFSSMIITSIFIIVPLFTFLLLNAFTGFKPINSSNCSSKTKATRITLLQASILQSLLLFITGVIPIIFLLTALVRAKTIIKMGYMECILNFYPLSDSIVILLFIKPHRDIICSICRKNVVAERSGTS